MPRYACLICGTTSDQRRCPRHRPAMPARPNRGSWSPYRDRAAQARFRAAVLARDGHACRHCGATTDLRAAHLVPLINGGTYDPANGITRCGACDVRRDPHARLTNHKEPHR